MNRRMLFCQHRLPQWQGSWMCAWMDSRTSNCLCRDCIPPLRRRTIRQACHSHQSKWLLWRKAECRSNALVKWLIQIVLNLSLVFSSSSLTFIFEPALRSKVCWEVLQSSHLESSFAYTALEACSSLESRCACLSPPFEQLSTLFLRLYLRSMQ